MRSVAGLAALGLAALAGCGAAGGQPMTTEQAELLAVTRFNNYRAETASFSVTVVVAGSESVRLTGVVDWRRHVGSAVLRTAGRTGEPDLLQWNLSTVAFHSGGGKGTAPPVPPRDGRWQRRPVQPEASAFDTVLLLLLNLGKDRPDNAQLLRQSAAFVRADQLGGLRVQVLDGPGQRSSEESRTRYWVDSEGRLRRFQARVAGQEDYTTIDLDTSGDPVVRPLPALVGD